MTNPAKSMAEPTATPVDLELQEVVATYAQRPTILVCCDYDGVLAPLVPNPTEAYPHQESVAALRTLSTFADTHVAVVSGRSLRDLAALSRLPSEIHLVGSHGSEFDAGFVGDLDADQIALRRAITEQLTECAATDPGFIVEKKPASVAFHYRNADPERAREAVAIIEAGPAQLEGVHTKRGKMVLELTVIDTNKGTAIERLRRQTGAEAVFFMGDDVTDEDGFAVLAGPDVSVKVGEGETLAHYRVADTHAAVRLLAELSEQRCAWLEGSTTDPIEQHSLLSDQRTLALVSPEARINWMCFPRADSPAVFAELVGGPAAGYFSVHPASGSAPISQRYVDDTLILQTRWAGLTVTDYLDVSGGRADETAGHSELIRVLEGKGEVVIEFAPRLDYGRAPTQLTVHDGGLHVGGAMQQITLASSIDRWSIVDDGMNQTATATLQLDGTLVLRVVFGNEGAGSNTFDEAAARAATAHHWSSWAQQLVLPTVAPAAVLRSALTIKALCHQPTGAMLAAGTTSLPEVAGGVRNWDYRYCWPRDAALAAATLVDLGATAEAEALLGWLLERVEHCSGPEHLRPLYAVAGDDFLPEAVLPTLNGYLGSRPVRIGNAADQQVQLDVFGPVVNLAHRLAVRGEAISDDVWKLVSEMVTAVERRWHEPDHGIWEERRPQRHHVHSKVMCWLAVDRALAIATLTGREPGESWDVLRSTIAADVIANGWNEEVGAFTIAYGDDELDASVLWIGLSGLLDATDPRFVATVVAIEHELRHGHIVYRYRLDDGLPGDEGGFLICTAWLIEAYVLMGQRDNAKVLFDRYLDLAGRTGLLSEEYDPRSNKMLGNHPQAYSHLGLINAALALSR